MSDLVFSWCIALVQTDMLITMHWACFLSLCQNSFMPLPYYNIFTALSKHICLNKYHTDLFEVLYLCVKLHFARNHYSQLLKYKCKPLHMQKVTGMPSHPAVKAEWIDFDVVVLLTRSPVFNCLPQSDNDTLWQFCFRKWFAILMLIGCCQHAYA